MLRRAGWLLGIASLVIFACGGDDDSGSTVSPQQACSDASAALCAKLDECAPFFVKTFLVDQATCAARFNITCASSFTANGTSATPARAAQCALDLKVASCDDILARKTPESCRTLPGTLPDGSVCGHDAQCQNKHCRIPKDASCGACSSLAAAGAPCEREEECDYELSCIKGKCLAKGKAGAPCANNDECLGNLGCNDGVCATPVALGAACTSKDDQNPCDLARGTYCHFNDKVCATIGSAGPGEACEFSRDALTACNGAARCSLRPGQLGKGTCEKLAADGATCNDASGPYCQFPARCVKGVCTISDPASCK